MFKSPQMVNVSTYIGRVVIGDLNYVYVNFFELNRMYNGVRLI